MKKKILVLMLGFLLIAVNLYATGDLIVEGDAGIGTTTLTGKLNVKDATKVPLIIDNSTGTQNILEVKDNGASKFTIANDGNIGIGITPTTQRLLNIYKAFNTSEATLGYINGQHSGTGNTYGLNMRIASTSSGTKNSAYGGFYTVLQDGAGPITTFEGLHIMTGGTGTGAVTNNTPLHVMGALSAGTETNATTNARGIYIRNFGGTGTATNVYGIYLEQQTKGTNTYQIYSVGGKSYFGGDVGIGTTTPIEKLDVRGNITATQDTDTVSAIYLNRSGGPTSGWNSPGGTWGIYRYGTGEGDRFSIGIAGVNEPFRIHTDGNVIMGVTSAGASSGNVGIGVTNPTEKLEVAGNVKAQQFITGDITFQKDGEKLWRMFEDEDGLYMESLKTGKVYRFVLQEVERK